MAKYSDERVDNIVTSKSRSVFILHRYVNVHIDIYQTAPLRAATCIPTPKKFCSSKCGLVNIQNEDVVNLF